MEMGKPEVGQRCLRAAMYMVAKFECPSTAPRHHDGQIVVLVRRAIAHTGAQRKDRIVEQRGALCLFNLVHPLKEACEGENVESVQL